MKQKKIKLVITKKVTHIADLCSDISPEFDMDTIHEFRTSVKSLRSLLRLQKMYTGNKKIRLTKKFKQLYDTTGVIRESQLEIDFLKDMRVAIPHYIAHLHKTIAIAKSEWEQHYTKKILHKLEDKLAGYKYKQLDPHTLGDFLNDRMEAVSRITDGQPANTQIHNARKRIKDILYVARLANKDWKTVRKERGAPHKKQLDALAETLGEYNDERIILEHLNTYPAGRQEKTSIKQLSADEAKKLDLKKKDVLSVTRKFINHLNEQNNTVS